MTAGIGIQDGTAFQVDDEDRVVRVLEDLAEAGIAVRSRASLSGETGLSHAVRALASPTTHPTGR